MIDDEVHVLGAEHGPIAYGIVACELEAKDLHCCLTSPRDFRLVEELDAINEPMLALEVIGLGGCARLHVLFDVEHLGGAVAVEHPSLGDGNPVAESAE